MDKELENLLIALRDLRDLNEQLRNTQEKIEEFNNTNTF